jgi:hypothetical protein
VGHSNDDFSEAEGYDKPYNIVFSADYAPAPGLVLAGDVAYFDLDTNGSYTGDIGDAGWAALPSRSEYWRRAHPATAAQRMDGEVGWPLFLRRQGRHGK